MRDCSFLTRENLNGGSCSRWSMRVTYRVHNAATEHLLIVQSVDSAIWEGDVDMCTGILTVGNFSACNGRLPAYHLHKYIVLGAG